MPMSGPIVGASVGGMQLSSSSWPRTILRSRLTSGLVGAVVALSAGIMVASAADAAHSTAHLRPTIRSASVDSYQIVDARDTYVVGENAGTGVDCPTGTRILGGGVNTNGGPNTFILGSHPSPSPEFPNDIPGWVAFVDNQSGKPITVTVYAICGN
jgi:hypothetical protein